MSPLPMQSRIDADILAASQLSHELGIPDYYGKVAPPIYFGLHLGRVVAELVRRVEALENERKRRWWQRK